MQPLLYAGVKLKSISTFPSNDGEQVYYQTYIKSISWSLCESIELFEVPGQHASVLWAGVIKNVITKHVDKDDTIEKATFVVNMAFVDHCQIDD